MTTLLNYKITTCNDMADGDLNRFLAMIVNHNESTIDFSYSNFISNGMKKIGEGASGIVYEFIGSDGYEYAVKVEYGSEDEIHDGQMLEKLQGIKGYPKLFSYIDGKIRIGSGTNFYIMISQKIKGFTVCKAMYDINQRESELLSSFVDNANPELVSIFEESIDSAYEIGITPRDIHSQNVMFDEVEGIVYIVDVGNYVIRPKNIHSYNSEDFMLNCSLNRLVKVTQEYKKKVAM